MRTFNVLRALKRIIFSSGPNIRRAKFNFKFYFRWYSNIFRAYKQQTTRFVCLLLFSLILPAFVNE